jgi:heme/copper-type cytochrome/quinol oxidase subunit 3
VKTQVPGLPRASSVSHEESATRWLGTVLGLAAWTMFFVSLFFAVGWYRMREPWPPLPTHLLVLAMPGLSLIVGSVGLHRAASSVFIGSEGARRLLRVLKAILVLGLGFVGVQAWMTHLAWWNHHLRIPDDGVPASAFYGLTALHALHMLAVVAGVFVSAVRLRRGVDVRDSLRRHALGWHFVTAMWLLLFAAVYLP